MFELFWVFVLFWLFASFWANDGAAASKPRAAATTTKRDVFIRFLLDPLGV
jgi:hypothetical protein